MQDSQEDLSEREMMIAKKAAELAVQQLSDEFYKSIGKNVVQKWRIRHEQEHLNQMTREGKLRFMANYVWWLLRYGYWNNPYEIEARKAAGQQ